MIFVEQDWTPYWPLGNTFNYRPSAGLCGDDHNTLGSAIQPVLAYGNVEEDSVKSLAEVKVDITHCSSLIQPASHSIT